MKRLRNLALISSLLVFTGSIAIEAHAELTTIFGPVYVSKTKGDHEKEAKLKFTAPVPGNGVLVIKNGGDSGEGARVSSAEVELNGKDIAKKRDFNKNVDLLKFDVQLLAENELEVEVKSCKECELEISIMGEAALPPRALPTRDTVVAPVTTTTTTTTVLPTR